MIEHYLDPTSSMCADDSHILVDSETEFLRQATGSAPLLICGALLCEWAERFFVSRNLPFRTLKAPAVELKEAFPDWSDQQASALAARLGKTLGQVGRPLHAAALLQLLYPMRLWQEPPSVQHAAGWLLWLLNSGEETSLQPLLALLAAHWQAEADSTALQLLYSAVDAESAGQRLEQWLGVRAAASPADFLTVLGPFPETAPPQLFTKVKTRWTQELVATRGNAILDLVSLSVPDAFQRMLGALATDYFERHPQDLGRDAYAVLAPSLLPKQQQRLQRYVPPPEPRPLPTAPKEVLTWCARDYLPYRTWQHLYGDETAAQSARAAAEQFILWYLDQYPKGLLSGELYPHLSFKRSRDLAEKHADCVTLLVVLDGLLWGDAQLVTQHLQDATPRLSLLENALAFAPLPTVTQFCKDALFKGLKPAAALDQPPLGKIVPEAQSPLAILQHAQPGEVYLWRVSEPDSTYHKRNSYASLKNDIEARLQAIAKNIVALVNEVDASLSFRIVITSDHGRLLGKTVRTRTVPAAMQTHGRAAWGSAKRQFPAAGYLIEDGIVYLHHGRYGLIEDAAVLFTEEAFETSDGRGGSERYPHGGLYPEEVVVPWLVFARDYAAPSVVVRCMGKAVAQTAAPLTIWVENAGEIVLTATRLLLTAVAGVVADLPLQVECSALFQSSFEISLPRWPTPQEAEHMSARITLQTPDRRSYDIEAQVEIGSEEMYSSSSNNILGDLD